MTSPSVPPPETRPPASPETARESHGAESPHQTDEARSAGEPPTPDGGDDANRSGLRRPAGGSPNVPRG